MRMTLTKILNLCGPIFSSEDGDNNRSCFALFSLMEILHLIVSVVIFSRHFSLVQIHKYQSDLLVISTLFTT